MDRLEAGRGSAGAFGQNLLELFGASSPEATAGAIQFAEILMRGAKTPAPRAPSKFRKG